MKTFKDYVRAFQILERNAEAPDASGSFDADRDILRCNIKIKDMSDADIEELEALGWYLDDDDYWYVTT